MADRPHAAPPGIDDIVRELDHVSIAVADIAATLPLMELLGAVYITGGNLISEGFRWVQFAAPGGSKIELIQPLDSADDDHFLVQFLRERGAGVHHLTFRVADIAEAVARARERGFTVVGVNTEGDWKEAFVHPRSASGVLIQLAEWSHDAPFTPLEDVLSTPGESRPA